MKISIKTTINCTLVALLFLAGGCVTAKESTAKILAPWKGEGEVFKVGPKLFQFVGKFEGIMYIEKEGNENDFDTAIFVCPAVQEIQADTMKTEATGRCILLVRRVTYMQSLLAKAKLAVAKGNLLSPVEPTSLRVLPAAAI